MFAGSTYVYAALYSSAMFIIHVSISGYTQQLLGSSSGWLLGLIQSKLEAGIISCLAVLKPWEVAPWLAHGAATSCCS